MTAEEFVADDPGRAARRRRGRRRLGLSFRQGPVRHAGLSRRGGRALWLRASRSSPRSRTATANGRRLVDGDPPGARARRRRRGGAGPRAPLFGLGTGHSGPAARPHARRADRQYRARADQPAGARRLRGRGPGRRARLSRRSPVSASGRRSTTGRRCSKSTCSISTATSTGARWRSNSSSASGKSGSSIRSTRWWRRWSATRRGRATSCARRLAA